MEIGTALAIAIPFALIDVGLKIYSTLDLAKTFDKRSEVNKVGWLIAIWIVNLFGWMLYLIFGRIPAEKNLNDEKWD
jgi:hypothetical protein